MTPLIVYLLLRQTAEVGFQDMVGKLALLVLLPMVAARLVAAFRPVGRWAIKHRRSLNVAAQVGILMMVLLGTSQSVLKLGNGALPQAGAAARLLTSIGMLHMFVLVAGYWLAGVAEFPRPERIAVAFSGSQKTLMIGLLVCIQLGVSLVPMVLYHAVQLILDTFVADWFARRGRARESS
jgi:sodium/bile acid cotransporter 7